MEQINPLIRLKKKKKIFQPNKLSNDMNCVLELCFFNTQTINDKNRNILHLTKKKNLKTRKQKIKLNKNEN